MLQDEGQKTTIWEMWSSLISHEMKKFYVNISEWIFIYIQKLDSLIMPSRLLRILTRLLIALMSVNQHNKIMKIAKRT